MSNFDDFEDVKIENFGYVKLPEININQKHYDRLKLSKSDGYAKFFEALVREGFEDKKKRGLVNISRFPEYGKRLTHELSLLEELGFTEYCLLVWLVIEKARELGAFIDYGRGSMVSSLCFYSLGITGADPIEYNLIFERFVNRARSKKVTINGQTYLKGDLVADADLNLGQTRDEVRKWLEEIYPGQISSILTLGTFTGKKLVTEVFKCYSGATPEQAKRISDMVEKHQGIVEDIEVMPEKNVDFKEWSEKHKEDFNIALKLRDLIASEGKHASGYLLAHRPLFGYVPLQLNQEGYPSCGYTKDDAAEFALKLDLLGLATNGLLKKIESVIPEKLDDITPKLKDDENIYKHYQDGKLAPYGLYQISAETAYRVLNKFKPRNLLELSDVSATARPGALAYVDDYVNNSAKAAHPSFESIVKETRNVVLYQEQILQVAIALGFNSEEAELLRRTIGKKKVEEVAKWKVKIAERAKSNGFDEKVTDAFIKITEDNAKYGFNKCLHPLTLVKTIYGYKYMSDIKIGDEIACFDVKRNINVYEKVKNIYNNNVELYLVTTSSGQTIKCSIDHKFYTKNGMKRLGDCFIEQCEIYHRSLHWVRIESIVSIGFYDTLDFEIASAYHNFYANDILVSNSHSVATSMTSALTTYLKYKYPLQFFWACLSEIKNLSGAKPQEEIAAIEREMNQFGIKLLPPDLVKSDMDFKIEGGDIRFGLGFIKGISEKTIENFKLFVNKEKTNKIEVFNALKECKLGVGVGSAIAQAGCLQVIGENRPRLVLELQVFNGSNVLSDTERMLVQKFLPEHNNDILKTLLFLKTACNDKGKRYITDKRWITFYKKYEKYKAIWEQNNKNLEFANWYFETQLLGFSYSSNLRKVFADFQDDLMSFKEIKSEVSGIRVKGVGQILEIRSGVSKAKKANYVKMTLVDETEKLNFMIFNDAYDNFMESCGRKLPDEGTIITFSGTTKEDGTVFGNSVAIQDWKIYTKLSELKDKETEEKT